MKIGILSPRDLYVPRREQPQEKLRLIYLLSSGWLILSLALSIRYWFESAFLALSLAVGCLMFVAWFLFSHFSGKAFGLSYFVLLSLLTLLLLNRVYESGGVAAVWLYPYIICIALTVGGRCAVLVNIVVCFVTAVIIYSESSILRLFDIYFAAFLLMLMSHGAIFTVIALQRKLQESSFVDPLTKLYNRRYLSRRAAISISEIQRHGVAYAGFMIDLDHFKSINDTFGHGRGDQVIQDVAMLLAKAMRTEDSVFRLGGEEFFVIARVDDAQGMSRVAEAVRKRIREAPILGDRTVTVSIGAAMLAKGYDLSIWLRHSDTALYQAKRKGRDRCEYYSEHLHDKLSGVDSE